MRARLSEARPAGPDTTASNEPRVGVGPDGEVGAEFRELDETAHHDPNAERTITLTLNDYEAERVEKFAATSIIPSDRPVEEITTDGRDRRDNAIGAMLPPGPGCPGTSLTMPSSLRATTSPADA